MDLQPIKVDHVSPIIFKPMKLGLEFDYEQEAYEYYNDYAGEIGFSIRKEYVNKSRTYGFVTSRKLVCFKEGFREQKKQDVLVKTHPKETRTNCLAHIVIRRQLNGKYQVTDFEEKHNHPLAPKSCAHLLPSQRKITDSQSYVIDLADDSGIAPKLAFEMISRESGGRDSLGFTDIDQKNYLRSKRKRSLMFGEAGSLLDYFEKRKVEDPSFFFSIQLDVNDLITNIFWTNAKMIADYNLFGDVVSFDTTYQTNKEYRPFAIFVGMNNHRRMVIFGAALLYDETIDSFQWLFRTFLRAMSEKKPKTILTDQDAAMSKAISLVMPESYHRLCAYHLGTNALKHLGHLYKNSSSFGADFSKLIYEYETPEEFLKAWDTFLEMYGVQENKWLKGIFALKEKWSMAYGKNTFSAGLKTTQLSESFNKDLKMHLKVSLDVVRFFKHYENAVADKRYNELKEIYDMTQRLPALKVDIPLLRYVRDVYTSAMFEKFQNEWVKSLLVLIVECKEEGSVLLYKVKTTENNREHMVTVVPVSMAISCNCKHFEFEGILCSHTLKILDAMNVKEKIPDRYILKRWTKDPMGEGFMDIEKSEEEKDPKLKACSRYRVLCSTFVKIATMACESEAGSKLAAKYANELISKLKEISKEQGEGETSVLNLSIEQGQMQARNTDIVGVKGLKGKQRSHRGTHRLKSCLEKSSKKKRTLVSQPPPYTINSNQMVCALVSDTSPQTELNVTGSNIPKCLPESFMNASMMVDSILSMPEEKRNSASASVN